MLSQAVVEFGAPLQEIETPTPAPQGTEVLLKVHNAGVCHSDVHIHDGYFDLGGGNKLPMANIKLPHTMGHEIEGEVIAVGPDVKDIAIGARYAAFPWIGCGKCPSCLRGEENICVGGSRQLGCSNGCPGGYATHVMVPHPKYLIDYGKIDPALGAAYMCSGVTAYAAMKKVGALGPKDQVLVLGVGGVGMMGVQFARAMFGKGPLAADIDEGRLEAAKKAGASATYNTKVDGEAKRLMAETGGGAYAVIDFVGSEKTFAFASQSVRRGGKIIIVGLFGGAMAMPLPMFPFRTISIGGSMVGSLDDTKEMMELVRAGKVDPIPYTKRPLSQANQALTDLVNGKVTGRVVLDALNALYDTIGAGYVNYRKPDPRIAAMIEAALGDAKSVVNVGAGTGSYEPRDRHVVAVEPSELMISQRPPGAAEAIRASADALPFADEGFDAALALLTVHHWPDQIAGLREMARVARERCVILTWDVPETSFWLTRDYFPQILEHDRRTFSLAPLREALGEIDVRVVPVPHDCTDGFLCAYWRRPEMYLDAGARRSISSFSRLGDVTVTLAQLKRDLDDGTWMRRNGHLMDEKQMDHGYRLVVAERRI